MKIMLIGNYVNSRQQSMQRFADLMLQGLSGAGHEVRLVTPPVILGRLISGETGIGKWLGYIDRFLLYIPLLLIQVRWADVVHICDHGNAMYIPYLRGKPYLITCHDMLAIKAARGDVPGAVTGWSGKIFQRWILHNLHKARHIVCVSEQTRQDVLRITGIEQQRVTIIPNALNYPYTPMAHTEAIARLQLLGLDITRPYFLHVGGNQWYKNRDGVLRIFNHLRQHAEYEHYQLVLVGKPWTRSMQLIIQDLELEGHVEGLFNISNEDLRAVYSASVALLFPSLQEGFGWPIIEALSCGSVVITSNRPPMNVVGGNIAIYIDPADETGSVDRIVEGLKTKNQRRQAGIEESHKYEQSAFITEYENQYFMVYKDY